MNITGIHHIAIITDDYERSKKFYTQVLGFKILAENYREERKSFKLDLALGDKYLIELFSFPDVKDRASFPESKGLRHLAFAVENIEDAVKELQQQGIDVQEIRIDKFTSKRFCFFNDPNGQPLELYEAP